VDLKSTRPLLKTFIQTLVAAVLGSILVAVSPGAGPQRPEPWAFVFGAFFGGWVGFLSSICFNYVERIHRYAVRTRFRIVLTLGMLGGMSGAMVLFWFGDGLMMALGLTLEGAVFGGFISLVLSVLVIITERHW
jgi:H+/Cl- antiporter ClcA